MILLIGEEKVFSTIMPDTSIYQSYKKRFGFRIVVFSAICLLYTLSPQSFSVLNPGHFFKHFSVLHIFWAIWARDILLQMIPEKGGLTLGSRKQFKVNYVQSPSGFKPESLKQYRHQSNITACKVLILWLAITAFLGVLWFKTILTAKELLLIAAIFSVCDLFCVLYWCPFQSLIMKNRCCLTCRIFNWDSLMIFSPLVFIGGFFSLSLLFLSLMVFISWEVRFFKYPERFWEGANETLKCRNCMEKICINKKRCQ